MFTSKKIDLHLHFDGSLPLSFAYAQAMKHPEFQTMDEQSFLSKMQVADDCHSLYDYLARFDTPLKLLQDAQALYDGMLALIQQLAEQGLLYAEIRFAPQQHIHGHLTQQEVVETLLQARKKAAQDYPQIKVNYILCMMILGEEALTHEANLETIRLCRKYIGNGVVALDLAGAEGMAPMQDFADLFALARSYQLPLTIHAGESYGPENIKTAIQFGASRIGHGTTAIQDETVLCLLKEKQIPLEVCVSSNVHCEVVTDYDKHPIRFYKNYGIPVTINTDNMTISHTNLEKEYTHLQNELAFTYADILQCLHSSIDAAFLPPQDKTILHQKIDK